VVRFNSSSASARSADACVIANPECITVTDSRDAKHARHADARADSFTDSAHASRDADAFAEHTGTGIQSNQHDADARTFPGDDG